MSTAGPTRNDDSWRRREALYDRFEQAWSVGGAARIEDHLPPADAPDRTEVLRELVRIDLERRRARGDAARFEDYVQRFPELAGQAGPHAGRTEAGGPRPDDAHTARPSTLAPPPGGPTARAAAAGARLGRYELCEELGRGGFSTVFRARDAELGRDVAIKLPRHDLTADPELRARVLREARSAARLRHPAIVPLLEVGQDGATTWLVYEFVNGPTLAQFLRQGPPAPGQAACWAAELAEALDYAHRNGIIHRDVKPANILLSAECGARSAELKAPHGPSSSSEFRTPHSEFRTPKLTDFGLALHADAATKLTREGDVLGTPAYMSPEQAIGRGHAVDARTDVYSLGVVLYEMLAGRVPFQGTTPSVLNQVLHDEPPPPRSVRPEVPADLETICLKAMAKEPAARYATAGELADDLRRFLAHRPIRARRVGPLGRLRRWRRREPKAAALAATALVILLLGLAGVGGLWRHNQRQAAAQLQADLDDLDRELGFVGSEEFALVPQMDQARRRVLEQLAAKCQALLDRRGDRPELALKTAEVRLRLGTILELLGRHDEAEQAYREAVALHERAGARDDRAHARARFQLANLFRTVGRLGEAEALLREALDLQSSPDATADRADTLHKLGGLLAFTGRFTDAEQALNDALKLQRAPADERPGDAGGQLALAQAETTLAGLLAHQARLAEARPLIDAAVARQQRLADARPGVPVNHLGLARSLAVRGRVLERAGRDREGAADMARSYEILKKLADEHPHRPDYRFEAAAALHNVGRHDDKIAGEGEFPRDGVHPLERRYRAAVAEQQRLLAEFPAVVDNRRRLAVSLNSLATWLGDKSSYQQRWLPQVVSLAEAAALHQRSEALWEQLAADYPAVLEYQNGLAVSRQRRGIVLERLGRLDDAERGYRAAVATQARLADQYPNVASHRISLSALNNNIGVLHDRRRDLPGAEAQFREAVAQAKRAREINALDSIPRILLGQQLDNLASVLIRRGRYREAAPFVDESLRVWPPSWWLLHIPFRKFQFCIAAANRDAGLPTPERARLVKQYEDWTMEHLKASLAADTAKGAEQQIGEFLTADPGLSHVRHRPDFQQLLRDHAAKASRAGKP